MAVGDLLTQWIGCWGLSRQLSGRADQDADDHGGDGKDGAPILHGDPEERVPVDEHHRLPGLRMESTNGPVQPFSGKPDRHRGTAKPTAVPRLA